MSKEMRLFTLDELMRLGDLTGGMVHEVNNPLTIVTGHLSLLKILLDKGDVPTDKLKDKLDKVESALDRANEILGNARKLPRSYEVIEKAPYKISFFIGGIKTLLGYSLKKRDIYIQEELSDPELEAEMYWEELFVLVANICLSILYVDRSEVEEGFLRFNASKKDQLFTLQITSSEQLPNDEFTQQFKQIIDKHGAKVQISDKQIVISF